MAEILSADDFTFDQHLKDNKLLIVDFWSPSCIPCRMMDHNLELIAGIHGTSIKIIKINVNESPKTSSRYLVRTLPTLLFIQNQKVKSQLTGAVNSKQIGKVINEICS